MPLDPRTYPPVAKKRIGEVLKEARLEAGLSARDLERATGLGTGEISQIETGRRLDPAFSVVLRLARGIGISMEDLALRYEGRQTGLAPDAWRAKTAAALARLKAQYDRLGSTLDAASNSIAAGSENTSRVKPRTVRRPK